MTSDEIRAAIDRLMAIPCDTTSVVYSVASAFMDMEINASYSDIGLRNRLIALLRQADPETHMELPKDADGVPIHIGDRMEDNERVVRIVLTDDSRGPYVYLEKLPSVLHEYFCHEVRHYHKPTVEEVLKHVISYVVEYAYKHPDNEIVNAYIDEIASVYGEHLRKLMGAQE